MFLLDTNVLSALMHARPPAPVAAWVAGRAADLLHTAAVCQAEILAGIAVLPEGQRRRDLEAAARAMFLEDLEGRVLAFDGIAAQAFAKMFAVRRRAGRSCPMADLMVAATARAHGASVVTRNVADFEGCGVPVIDPWE